MEVSTITYHILDMTFKDIANNSINELLEFVNIDYKVTESVKTEFSELKNKRYHLDYVGKTKDKIYIHIEFQTKIPTKEDLKRIFTYAALLHEFTGCFVETYIICVQPISKDHIIYKYSKHNIFKITVISLKNIDGNEKINSINKKIENNEKLTKTEILSLKLMPFTSYNETVEEMTLKTAQLTNKITTLTPSEINKIKYIQQAVCSKVISKDKQSKIMEEIKMRNTLYDQAWTEAQELGRAEGEKIGRTKGEKIGMEKSRKEIENEINKRIKQGMPLEETLKEIGLLKNTTNDSHEK